MFNYLLERLAALEHDQWAHWAAAVTPDHPLIDVPYEDLSEEDKEKDRFWARKVLDVFHEVLL